MKCPLENYPLICHHRRMCVRPYLPPEILTQAQNATTREQRETAAATIRNHLGTEKSFRLDTSAPCWSFLERAAYHASKHYHWPYGVTSFHV